MINNDSIISVSWLIHMVMDCKELLWMVIHDAQNTLDQASSVLLQTKVKERRHLYLLVVLLKRKLR